MPSGPRAGRPASGPASLHPCRSLQEIPRATSSNGSRAGSLELRRPRMAPVGRRASPTVKPQRPACPCPGAAQGCSRPRGAPRESLGARLTPQVAAARMPAIFFLHTRGPGCWPWKLAGEPGGPTRSASGAARSTKRMGGGRPPGRPGSVLERAPSVTMKALPRVCVSFRIFLCFSPGGEGDRSFPGLAGGIRGSWSLTRPPAARERGALPDSRDSQAWSLSLSLCIYIYIYICIYT